MFSEGVFAQILLAHVVYLLFEKKITFQKAGETLLLYYCLAGISAHEFIFYINFMKKQIILKGGVHRAVPM